ncbi:M15 family metallopeptidase [Dyella japonica]|uniref:Peptidase M15C domain-containing protein n=1 Tax=Dyella japonica TaxID=231455 RepID=A0ABV2JNX3_9GAMM
MAADLSVLVQPFRTKVGSLVDACARRGCELRPYMARRDPFEQARLWRQSRSIEEITKKIDTLKAAGAPFLAKCIDQVGPQSGSLVTNAPPGFSWHQWDEAVDCFWVVRGAAEWSTRRLINGLNGYQVLADEAEKLGLTAGGHWKSLKDWPHVQLRPAAAPSDAMSVKDINTAMQQRFG